MNNTKEERFNELMNVLKETKTFNDALAVVKFINSVEESEKFKMESIEELHYLLSPYSTWDSLCETEEYKIFDNWLYNVFEKRLAE